MGDHSKCGINTMFNTGTVVGVNANIYGAGFPRNFVPSFSWGGAAGFTTYQLDKAFEVAAEVMRRRDRPFDQTEMDILTAVFEMTEKGIPRDGYILFNGEEEVGYITSGTFSPTFKKGIGMGLVKTGTCATGDAIEIEIRNHRVHGKVVPRPFYKYNG